MPVTVSSPVPLPNTPTFDSWDIESFTLTSNLVDVMHTGTTRPSLRIVAQAVNSKTGAVQLLPPVVYSGDRLTAAMKDSVARVTVNLQAGQTADAALYAGLRDALYAALQADGVIPTPVPTGESKS